MRTGFCLAFALSLAATTSSCGSMGPNTCAALLCGSLFRTGSGSSYGGGTTRSIYGERASKCRDKCAVVERQCAAGCGVDFHSPDAGAVPCDEKCAAFAQRCVDECMPPEPID